MRLKLKESPSEWRKFALVWSVMFGLVAFLIWRRQVIGDGLFYGAIALAGLGVVLAMVVPRLFRGLYRAGMTLSYHVGQFMGMVILSVVFFLVVTPMGFLLRMMGKDLLELKRATGLESYWKPARRIGRFDQQF